MKSLVSLPFFLAISLIGAWFSAMAQEDLSPVAFFDQQVQPIFQEHCLKCHGGNPEKVKAEFSLTSRKNLLEGGEFGPAANVQNPAESLILQMISYKDDEHQMPPKGKLSDEKQAILKQWAEMGFPFNPATEVVWTPPIRANDPTKVNAENRNWWAYRPVVNPAPPAVADASWSKNPIDAFVRHQLDKKGLPPNGPADKAALLRRTFYNLIGLPPTPEETERFVSDASPGAFERVIDDLLARPQYGEKWGRHWLDLVRFAESDGYERDTIKPHIWRYRDYVIDAFNNDTPYDRFILEQLAGDELPNAGPEAMIATGYYRLGTWDDEPADRELNRYDVFDGIVATTGEAFLGMSLGCARCHDHKIDPIPTADYYSFLSFFRNVTDYSKGKGNIVSVMGERDKSLLENDRRKKRIEEGNLALQIYHAKNRFRGEFSEKSDAYSFEDLPLSQMERMSYRFYRDTFEKLPDFEKLRSENAGPLASNFFDPGVATRNEAIGMVYEANLIVLQDREYGFRVDSKDGSRLWVDGEVVVDNDGIHPMGQPKQGTRSLKKGTVPIRFEYFNTTGEPDFEVVLINGKNEILLSMPKAFRRNAVLVDDSRRDAQTWAYTTSAPGADWAQPDFDDRAWTAGKGGFGAKGTPGAVVGTEWRTSDIWLRRDFEVNEVPKTVRLSIHQDENATVYINGVLAKTFKGFLVKYESFELPGSLLRPGKNTLAVHARNAAGGQYIDVGLYDTDGVPDIGELMVTQGVKSGAMSDKSLANYKDAVKSLASSRSMKVTGNQVEALVVKEVGAKPLDTHVMLRGNPHAEGDKVLPRFPSILTDHTPEITATESTTGRRLALARWIASKDNPSTARVMVNRLWQHHFGRGIARSTSNFGRVGELPTHPELLEWLAYDFMHDKQWSMKKMHKQILLSRTYQMSSAPQEDNLAVDPQNNNFWRYDMRRLTAEEVRDSLINLTGSLNLKQGGKSFYSKIPDAILATSSTKGGKWGNSPEEERNRRSVYILVRRSLLDPMLTSFDLADTDSSCAVRFSTTVPTQALTMLNGEFVNDKALRFAERLRRDAHGLDAQVRLGLSLATCRAPHEAEVKQAKVFVSEIQTAAGLDDRAALDRFALLCVNLNEFIFLD